MCTSTSRPNDACGLALTRTVDAPAAADARSAPTTYGVRPLAVSPTTMSSARTSAASAAPRLTSSSAMATEPASAATPPAWWAITRPGSSAYVGGSSAASIAAMRPELPAPK